ncbi:signal recognition particle subunit SRP68 [Rhincodon typus]|uniref:signal recognition particle subunit SRP68 n=1 Tax=Rhincodon typus TaxID=259920 RepID=UPI00203030C9|nr:signal recognition particle subunit SRP68 [Rhincodon typus]
MPVNMATTREDVGDEKDNPAVELGATLSLEILQIIKDSQQQHGLRHEDYQRYRGYCSRRLRRLRKALGFKMGNKHKFTGKKVTTEILSDNSSPNETTTDEAKERLYESLLSECRDAIQAVREELRVDPAQKQRERSLEPDSGKVSSLQYLHSYLTYIKLSTAIKRNVAMAEALQKQMSESVKDEGKRVLRPQDLIRLYDIILQNLSELPQLSGVEDDKTFQAEVELKTLVYKAYRCFFIAQSYVLVKKWSEALVLYERVLKYTSEAQTQTLKFTNDLQDLPDMKDLVARVNAEKYSVQAAAILDNEDVSEMVSQLQVKDNKPLSECLDVFRIDPSLVTKHANLVRFPPEFQPIPCKPLFFDLALNHATFPALEDKVEQKGRGGLTGYIKGFFGFRG